MTVRQIDLDAIDTEVKMSIVLDGVEHMLAPITVDDYIANLKMIEKMGTTADVRAETDILITMIQKAFPTLTVERLWKLSLPQLQKLMQVANELNSTGAPDGVKTAEDGENPQTPAS